MPRPSPDSVYKIEDFLGILLQVDPHDQEPGTAADQLNCQSGDQNHLDVRRGVSLVIFED